MDDLDRISARTRLVALLGHPVRHSLSPRLQNAAFAAAGLDYCYLALEVRPEELEAALRGVRALGFAGINLTVPHKERAIPLLDEITDEARAIRAVNTAANRDGRWVGTNTDALGFRRLLELSGLLRPGSKVVLLGAGGAARAGLYVLGQTAREAVVLNRTLRRAEELVGSLPVAPGCSVKALPLEPRVLAVHLADADLLVNSTVVGMHPNEGACPVPESVEIPRSCAVVDMIYAPPRTRLVERAERVGARAVGGLGMLLHQAAAAFAFWTGVEPDLGAMEDGLRSALEEG